MSTSRLSYDGDKPDGFMDKSSIVAYLQRFAQHVNPDLREGVSVTRLTPIVNGYRLETSEGLIDAEHVIVATGGYHIPRRHPFAERLPSSVLQIDARSYRNPEALPDGPVLVVGNGRLVAKSLKTSISPAVRFIECGPSPALPASIPRQGRCRLAGPHGLLRHANQ